MRKVDFIQVRDHINRKKSTRMVWGKLKTIFFRFEIQPRSTFFKAENYIIFKTILFKSVYIYLNT